MNQRIGRNKLGTAKSLSTCYKLTMKENVNFYSKTKGPINFTDINIKGNYKTETYTSLSNIKNI